MQYVNWVFHITLVYLHYKASFLRWVVDIFSVIWELLLWYNENESSQPVRRLVKLQLTISLFLRFPIVDK